MRKFNYYYNANHRKQRGRTAPNRALRVRVKVSKEPQMTNYEVLKLFIEKDPRLVVEMMIDTYCWGWNEGHYSAEKDCFEDTFSISGRNYTWLEMPYDKNFFRKSDIERLLQDE